MAYATTTIVNISIYTVNESKIVESMIYNDINVLFPVTWNEVSAVWYEIRLNGLKPMEAGEDQSAANAALLLGRVLYTLEERLEYVLSELESVSAGEWAPDQGGLLLGIAEEDEAVLSVALAELQNTLAEEYAGAHSGLRITMKKTEPAALPALHPVDLQKAVFYLIQLPHGVQKMSGVLPGEADTLCCLTGLNLLPDGLHCEIRVGSRIESAGNMLADRIVYLTEFLGGEAE